MFIISSGLFLKKSLFSVACLFLVLFMSFPVMAFDIPHESFKMGGAVHTKSIDVELVGEKDEPLLISYNNISPTMTNRGSEPQEYAFGGAMFFNSADTVEINGYVNINNNSITPTVTGYSWSNHTHGGGIAFKDCLQVDLNGNIEINGNIMKALRSNSNTNGGGVSFYNCEKININGDVVAHNNVTTMTSSSSDAFGSVMAVRGGEFVLNGSLDLRYNETRGVSRGLYNDSGSAGALYFIDTSDIKFAATSNVYAYNNEMPDGINGFTGGVFHFYKVVKITFMGTMTLNKNTAGSAGGAMLFYASGNAMEVIFDFGSSLTANDNCSESYNSYAGAISFFSQSTTSMSVVFNGSASFANNKSSVFGHGGAVYFRGNISVNFNGNVDFQDNYGAKGGALAFQDLSSVNFSGIMTFTENDSCSDGVLFFQNIKAVNFLSTANLIFEENDGNSGIISFVADDEMNVYFKLGSNITARNNEAHNGGAFNFDSMNKNSLLFVQFEKDCNITIDNNEARNFGGAFHIESTYFITLIFDVGSKISITNNTANEGGAFYFSFRATNYNDSMFNTIVFAGDMIMENNTATENGDAIFVYAYSLQSSSSDPSVLVADIIFEKSPIFINQSGYPIYLLSEFVTGYNNYMTSDLALINIYKPPAGVNGYAKAEKKWSKSLSYYSLAPNASTMARLYEALPVAEMDENGHITKVTPIDSPFFEIIYDASKEGSVFDTW